MRLSFAILIALLAAPVSPANRTYRSSGLIEPSMAP
jgi:hypothetical protein